MADKTRNVILFTGEGSHQLTFQEIANFFQYDLKPVIFVLNNKGYTIERILSKGENDSFNDITNWDYSKAPSIFANCKNFYYDKIDSIEKFDSVNRKIKEFKGKKLCYIEILLEKCDATKCAYDLVSNMKKFTQSLL